MPRAQEDPAPQAAEAPESSGSKNAGAGATAAEGGDGSSSERSGQERGALRVLIFRTLLDLALF